MEQIRDDIYRNAPRSQEPVYYWHVYRKLLRGKGKYGDGWKFVRDLAGTKRQAADMWCKWFRDGQHRLKCVLKYPKA